MNALLALFARSLRHDVRAKSTYWARAGLVGFILFMMYTTHTSMGWAGAPGLKFFSSLIYMNFFFISLAGLSYFASVITEEKEEMTLGLLQMTNLNPLSILLGKSTSRLCGGLLLLAAQLPFTMLAVSLGGVSVTQILAVYLALAAYLVLLSAVGLLASVVCARTAGAAILTGSVVALFLAAAPISYGVQGLSVWLGLSNSTVPGPAFQAWVAFCSSLSPLTRFSEVLMSSFSDSLVGPQVIGCLALGIAFFLLAWAVFNLFCRDQKEVAPRRTLLFRRQSRFASLGAGRTWKHALIWKDFYFLNGGKFAVILKLLGYAAVLWLIVYNNYSPASYRWTFVGLVAMWTMTLVFVLELAIIAGRIFRQERLAKTLSSLAMLPVSMRRLGYQKLVGSLLACWPAAVYGLAGAAITIGANWKSLTTGWYELLVGRNNFLWGVLGGFAMTAAVALFFLHLVVHLSLRLKWGAVPLAFALTWVICGTVGSVSFLMFSSGGFFVVTTIFIVAAGVLHAQIGPRLEHLAAEE